MTKIFNLSLSTWELPGDWKKKNVVPIYKPGERILAENYCPVSLTSIAVKILERVVHKHVMNFLTEERLLCENQYGFRKYRSCLTNKRGAIDSAFLDFAKAIDKMSIYHLFSKLQSYGIKGQLLEWIKDFLSRRNQRVVINGHESN